MTSSYSGTVVKLLLETVSSHSDKPFIEWIGEESVNDVADAIFDF